MHVSLALNHHANQVRPRNLLGRLITINRVLGRFERFYDPVFDRVIIFVLKFTQVPSKERHCRGTSAQIMKWGAKKLSESFLSGQVMSQEE